MNIEELKNKPVWQMSGAELLYLTAQATPQHSAPPASVKPEKRYAFGIRGIAETFGCSLPTANRIKASGRIDAALVQVGRKVILDCDLALQLAGRKIGGRR